MPSSAAMSEDPLTSTSRPRYSEMIAEAVSAMKEQQAGSSRRYSPWFIAWYIMKHYPVGQDVEKIYARVKGSLKAGQTLAAKKERKPTPPKPALFDKAPKSRKARNPKKAAKQ